MRLYCVNDYLEECKWFLDRASAQACFESLFEDRPQEKSEMLEIVMYRTTHTPTEVALAVLNGDGWADEIVTVQRAKPSAV